ncbi:MAG: hypothetical protein H7246_17585 [Phycisphaerae bacterium]|nr:hypothetical protein [Saprospiraceae bacterium]
MNWKMNYWTLLFALAVLGLGYQRFVAKKAPLLPSTQPLNSYIPCSTNQHYNIEDSIADQRITRYMNQYAQKVQIFASANCNTLNGGVQYFGIKKCEIQDMAAAFSLSDSVNAYVGLIPGTGSAKDTLDLVFKVFTTSGAVTHMYYDFTRPCPPCPLQ